MRFWRLAGLREGMTASYSETITDDDAKAFAEVSGYYNPIHLDDKYASQSRLKRRVARGFHSASFFSGIFGPQHHGKDCFCTSRSLNFKRPVYWGNKVTASVTVFGIYLHLKKVDFGTLCKVRNKLVISETPRISLPKG